MVAYFGIEGSPPTAAISSTNMLAVIHHQMHHKNITHLAPRALLPFPVMSRCLLPVFVSLMFLLVSVVLLVLLFLVVSSTFLLDAFGLELGGEDDGPARLHVEFCGEFLASFIVDRRPHFC